tara:strand:- start:962 stop:1705 length:744 start_codon:yes stop_codon:yes gene_type:complete
MLYSLSSNFKAVTGVYNNTVYVTTMKIGSISFQAQMKDIHYVNQDTFLPQFLKYLENPDIKRNIKLFIRDPFERYISGAIQNVTVYTGIFPIATEVPAFIRELIFLNDNKLTASINLLKKEYKNWRENGIPDKYLDLVFNLFKIYFEKSAVYELYHDPHVQPFYTPINNLLVNNKINTETLFLKDFNWKLTPTQLIDTMHSNKVFRKVAIEAFNQVNNEILIDTIKSETVTYNHLLGLRKDVILDYI